MNLEHKIAIDGEKPLYRELTDMGVKNLPFLPIESDGNPFTQVTLAQLEVFCLQANRIHERMNEAQKRLQYSAKKN